MDEGPTLGFENVFHQLKGFSNQNITFETLPMFCFCIMIISTIIIMIKMYFFITKGTGFRFPIVKLSPVAT